MPKLIRLYCSELFVAACFSLFDWLFQLSKSSIVVLNENKSGILRLDKKPEEVITFDFNYEIIGKKFYDWCYSKNEYWNLTKEEALMFVECCHAAHYHLSKQNYNIGENRDNINWLYNEIIREFNLEL